MTDAELKTKLDLLIILHELHTRRLLDRDKLDIKIESLTNSLHEQIIEDPQ